MRRLPLILGLAAALAALLLVAPVAVAVVLLRSSSDAYGPSIWAQILIAVLVAALVAAAGIGVWAVARYIVRRVGASR
ncbi:MAG TPA: hypothetical protein VFO69_09795 [Allosphingosinicella sp.]|nr:hypothetical protein [Allosphingosinicella sp.]